MRNLLLLAALAGGTSAFGGEISFSAKPTATRDGDKVKIAFSVSAPTDVEVAVVDAAGKVVRSLAAGVLGATNPPPAPLKPGLAQELVWDGKGDWSGQVSGVSVQVSGNQPDTRNLKPDTSFRVRVRAGMGAKFGRTLGDSSHNFATCRGLAVDPKNGDLYYLGMRSASSILFLRAFDRTGKYLREIMPYPATLDAKSRAVFGSVSVPGMEAPAPMNYFHLWPSFYPYAVWPENVGSGLKIVAFDPANEAVVMMDESLSLILRIRKEDGGEPAGGAMAGGLWPAGTKLPYYGKLGPVAGAVSPDGKTYYFAGYSDATDVPKVGWVCKNPAWPEGRIYKLNAGGKVQPFADVQLPAAHFVQKGSHVSHDVQALHGVAVNRDGKVLVCDGANGKVWVFEPDGKEAGAVSVPKAYGVVVDDKTGALYVLTRTAGVYPKCEALLKVSGWGPDAKVLDTLKINLGADAFMVGDFSGPVPRLWLGTEAPVCIEDRGGKLVEAESLGTKTGTAAGFACRMDVDPEADLVYLHNGQGTIRRYSGLTGDFSGTLLASEFCVRRDGMVYLSGSDYGGGGFSGPWRRVNRDLSPVPLPDGRKEFAGRYGKLGGGYFGNQGACVTPDGHLYFNGMFTFRSGGVYGVNPDGSLIEGARLKDIPAQGGFKSALIGWLPDKSGGVEIDQQGNLYCGICTYPRGYTLPGDLGALAKKNGGINPYRGIGSVIKFRPGGGGIVPDAKPGTAYKVVDRDFTVPDKLEPGLPMERGEIGVDRWGPTYIEGAVKAYPLLAPFSVACGCQTPRFDVDDYGRLYIPNALTCSVRVVDNEGNEILTFGSYGNYDSQGPGSAQPKPEIPMAYPVAAKASFKHIYVADSANRRAVRVDPTWKAEETCEVR
jgi:hypothetical protein